MLRKLKEMTGLIAMKSFCCFPFAMFSLLTLLVACSDDGNDTVVAPQLGAAQTVSGTGGDAANQKIENLEHVVSDLMAEWQQIKTDLEAGIMPDIDSLKTSVNELHTDLDEISKQLDQLTVIINSAGDDKVTTNNGDQVAPIIAPDLPGAERVFYIYGVHILEQNMATGIVRPIRRVGHPDRQRMCIEITESHIYWAEKEMHGNLKAYIYRMNRADENTEEIVRGINFASGLAVDESNGKIYWTSGLPARIQRANLDGTDIETIHSEKHSYTGLDIHGSYLYWTQVSQRPKIKRSALGGAQIETLIEGPRSWAVEEYNGKIYYTQQGDNTIMKANLDGTGQEVVVSGTDGWGMDVEGNHVYWMDREKHAIMRATLNGDNVQIVKDVAQGNVYDLAVE